MNGLRWSLFIAICGSLGCASDEPITSAVAGKKEQKDTAGATERDAGADAASSPSDADDDDDDGDDDAPSPPPPPPPKKDAGAGSSLFEACGEEKKNTGPVIPDMLIVLDRSQSMRPVGDPSLRCDNLDQLDALTQLTRYSACLTAGIDCSTERDRNTVNCGGMAVREVDRWTPSVAAIKSLTTSFENDVAIGLMTFPATTNQCAPGTLQVPISIGNGQKISMVLDRTQPGGGTPTGETLQRALEEFRSLNTTDVAQPARYVLLVTDGQPTCPNARGGGRTSQQELTADRQLTLAALDALRAENIKTYVVGYDAQLDDGLAGALTEFAQHGGTERYYPVQDEASLAKAFDAISQTIIKCDFELAYPVLRPTLVHVKLDAMELKLDDPNGWRIEGQTVTIQGAACEMLQAGRGHRIDISIECEPIM